MSPFRWLRNKLVGGTSVEGFQPLRVAVAKVANGIAIYIDLDSEREMVIALPRAGAVQMLDAMLNALEIGEGE